MSGFASIIGQLHAIGALTRLIDNHRIPNALLFTGIRGIGKRTTALAFASAYNCVSDTRSPLSGDTGLATACRDGGATPCGSCSSCKKIENGQHPDVILIRPEKSEIVIDQIRRLLQILAMKPYEAKLRVAIVTQADQMNSFAGNALLKILEEPPDKTLLILTAEQPFNLLPTIVSRCQQLRFRPLSRSEIADILTRQHGIPANQAASIASLCGGSVSRALEMNDPGWIEWRNWMLDTLCHWDRLTVNVRLGIGETLLASPAKLDQALDMLAYWRRDMLMAKSGKTTFIYSDKANLIRQAANRYAVSDLIACLEEIHRMRHYLGARGNPKLLMDNLMLKLA